MLNQNNIGILARGSVSSRLLVNKPAKAYLNYTAEEVVKAADAVRSLQKDGRVAAHTAIQFVLAHPAITAAVVGIRTIEQMEEAIKAIEVKRITKAEIELLKSVISANKYEQHR